MFIISGINHNIDELLVGIFTQISLRKKLNQKEEKEDSMNKVNVLRGPYSRLGNQETPLVIPK